jgi:hypothetical protein
MPIPQLEAQILQDFQLRVAQLKTLQDLSGFSCGKAALKPAC